MWKNSLKTVESDKKNLYEILLDFLQLNGTYFLNNPRVSVYCRPVTWIQRQSSVPDRLIGVYKSRFGGVLP